MSERDIAGLAVSDLTVAQTTSVDIRRLLRAILFEFGGEEGLAKELHQEFAFLTPGAPARSRLLVDIMRLVNSVGPDEDHEEDDIESLTATLVDLMKGGSDES